MSALHYLLRPPARPSIGAGSDLRTNLRIELEDRAMVTTGKTRGPVFANVGGRVVTGRDVPKLGGEPVSEARGVNG